jgi:hypothetical protein
MLKLHRCFGGDDIDTLLITPGGEQSLQHSTCLCFHPVWFVLLIALHVAVYRYLHRTRIKAIPLMLFDGLQACARALKEGALHTVSFTPA